MNISAPFVHRPIATALLMLGLLLGGLVTYRLLPVAALPNVNFPTIQVTAQLPGADPQTMASSVATPLEQQFSQIPGLVQLTSSNALGFTQLTVQFALNRNIDSAATDVLAAINAASPYLPQGIPYPPTIRKVNPAETPILVFGLTSDTLPLTTVDAYAENILVPKISQIAGVGTVGIGGQQKPAIRVQLAPQALANRGIGLEDVRNVLMQANVDQPKGTLNSPKQTFTLNTNDQLLKPEAYKSLIVAYRNGSPVHLRDVGNVIEGPENNLLAAWYNNNRAIILAVQRQPGANVIDTVDRIQGLLPQLQASLPPAIKINVISDRTQTVRASVSDVQFTLLLTVALVVMVIFVFLRNFWATVIPAVTVPLSLIGTFAVLYELGYSLDNLSLMALSIAIGFVVDDAVVVIENIVRHVEAGLTPMEAALQGSREIGFTIVSITLSLIAVFIPLFLMGGYVGELFQEFAVTVSVSLVLSLLISLTLTPMMCARLLKHDTGRHGWLYIQFERGFDGLLAVYARGLKLALRHRLITLMTLFLAIGLTGYFYVIIPKGFFPQQDTGMITAIAEAGQDISYPAMVDRMQALIAVVLKDPAVASTGAQIGAGGATATLNDGRMFIALKPLGQRDVSADQVIARLRTNLAAVSGITLYMQSAQDIMVGARLSKTQYQYTLTDADSNELTHWSAIFLEKLKAIPGIVDVTSDEQNAGPRLNVTVNRPVASTFGILPSNIDNTLDDAFGQRIVSTMFTPLNQYHVVMEVNPRFQTSPMALQSIYLASSTGQEVPLSTLTNSGVTSAPIAINHQGMFPSTTISFNLQPGGLPGRRGYGDPRFRAAQWQAGFPDDHVPRQRQRLPVGAGRRTDPGPGCTGGDLHHPGRALRKPDPSDHHSLYLAFCRAWSAASVDGRAHGPERDRDHRNHPADRYRQEERHHDRRFRARARTDGRGGLRDIDLSGLRPPFQADPDDNHGGSARWRAADAWNGQRGRNPPTARICHRRRPAAFAAADPVHDPGRLSLSRSAAAPRPARIGASARSPPCAGPGVTRSQLGRAHPDLAGGWR
ncbi:multidrug efflux pump [Bradyrhizobium sp. GM22.5]